MIKYLGKRYDVLISCIEFGRPFTCTDIGEHPNTIKGLANDGFLDIVGGTHERVPYVYSVPDRIRRHYGDKDDNDTS